MAAACDHCGSLNFEEERVGVSRHFALCCRNGKVAHREFDARPAPAPLHQLLTGRDALSRQFRDHIRYYNGAFAFVSFGSDYENAFVDLPAKGRAPPVVQCHGTVAKGIVAHRASLRTTRSPQPFLSSG